MNTELMFSKKSDEWETPIEFFMELDREFTFDTDVAANSSNHLCVDWMGPDHFDPYCRDSLVIPWGTFGSAVWCNPPYSMCKQFVAKAAHERKHGVTSVLLVPSRTDTRWWHECVWDRERNAFREGVEVRFVKGRLKFGAGKNSAPFPSVVIICRP